MADVGPARLHRFGIYHTAVSSFGETVIPALAIGVFRRGFDLGTLAISLGIAVGAAILLGCVRWIGTTYAVTGDALVLDTGIFSKKHVAIPRSRINAIDESQSPLARMAGVKSVKIQAAGGGKHAEIVLVALSQPAIDELRRAIGLSVSSDRPAPDYVLGGRLLLAGALTWGRAGLLLPVLGAVMSQADEFGADRLVDAAPRDPGTIALIAAAALVGVWIVSIAAALVAFTGFRVWVEPRRLRIERGLFQRRAASIPTHRIAGIRLVEGVLRQPFGLAMLRIEVAGFAKDSAESQVLCPVIRRRDVDALVARLAPQYAGPLAPPIAGPAGSVLLAAVAPVGLAAAAALVVELAFGGRGAVAWILVPVALLLGVARARAARLDLTGDRLLLRFRRLARTTLVTRTAMLEHVQAAQSGLQAMAGRASFIAGVGSGRRFRVHDVPEHDVRRATEHFAHNFATGRNRLDPPQRHVSPY